MLRSTNSTKSWNAISGQSYAAYHPKQCPGGSSGGSAVAVDLGLAWAAIGIEVREMLTISLLRHSKSLSLTLERRF